MKISRTFLVVATLLTAPAPGVAMAGAITPVPGAVPEPTALLVWLGMTAAGALFFWRRNREQ